MNAFTEAFNLFISLFVSFISFLSSLTISPQGASVFGVLVGAGLFGIVISNLLSVSRNGASSEVALSHSIRDFKVLNKKRKGG